MRVKVEEAAKLWKAQEDRGYTCRVWWTAALAESVGLTQIKPAEVKNSVAVRLPRKEHEADRRPLILRFYNESQLAAPPAASEGTSKEGDYDVRIDVSPSNDVVPDTEVEEGLRPSGRCGSLSSPKEVLHFTSSQQMGPNSSEPSCLILPVVEV